MRVLHYLEVPPVPEGRIAELRSEIALFEGCFYNREVDDPVTPEDEKRLSAMKEELRSLTQ